MRLRSNYSILILMGVVAAVMILFWMHLMDAKEEIQKQKRTEAAAATASHDQQFKKFNLTGFDNRGKTFWNLEGETARIEPSQTVYLDDKVTLHLKDNTVVHTDHVQWSQSESLMKTEAKVTLDHENTRVTGMGAVGRPSQSFIQLNRHIHMVMGTRGTLICDGPMKVYYNENKMIFFRHVKVTDARGTLSANRMDVFFDPVNKKIKEIIAVGDVVIQRGSDTTHSRRAIYSMATGSVRLEGNPEITMYKNGKGILKDGAFRN